MRLFTAIYPSAEALDHLDLALASIGGVTVVDAGPGLRWVPKEQRHVTLAFHGEVPDGRVPGFVESLDAALAPAHPCHIALAGGGSFSGRTLWAGVGEGVAALRLLAATVEAVAADAGFRADDRAGGRPHLTLARASASRGQPPQGRQSRNQLSRGQSSKGQTSKGQSSKGQGSRDRAPAPGQRRERDGFSSRGSGRGDAAGELLDVWAHALAIYRGPVWEAAEVCVVASRLGAGRSGGPLHENVARILLR
jgi:2'-5' RNA ligase